ncbi:CarD family transcriptional regulator [Faecalibacillus faecis]|uniref:CarD family transcriptional regulator n=1 Tax=Faecalibacillus faecis TaxID=1982628 RepID=UPI00386DFB1C
MFSVGHMVMHPNAGVCKIEDIRKQKFSKLEEQLYYILKPIYDNNASIIYVPVESDKVVLRRLLSINDIKTLIHSVSLDKPLWIENDARRNEKFKAILNSGDHVIIIQLIIEIHNQEIEKKKTGKKLHMADGRIMQEAEKMIHQEFAYSLKLDIDEVASYIMNELHIETERV